jgi:FkbM family methyltransferase
MYRALLDAFEPHPLVIADAGASGGLHPRWRAFDGRFKAVGFEPDERAYAALAAAPDRTWVRAALAGHVGQCELHVTKAQTATSVLMPNRGLVDEIFAEPDGFDIQSTVSVPCTPVDEVAREQGLAISMLKIDTQGSELDILRGAQRTLADTLSAVEVEVEFVELYTGQPLFADVDRFMREAGFTLLDLGNFLYHKWRRTAHVSGRKGQLISADALYVLPVSRLSERVSASPDPVPVLAWACAAVGAYGYPELILRYLEPWRSDRSALGAFARALGSEVERQDVRPAWRKLRGLGRLAQALGAAAEAADPHDHAAWRTPLGNSRNT